MGARSKGSCGILAGGNVIKADSFYCGSVKRPQKNGEPAAKSITIRRKIPRKARSISQQFCGESAAGFRKRSQPLLNQLANSILPVLVPPPIGGVSRASAVLLMPHQGLPRNVPGLSPEEEAPELCYEDRTALSALPSELVGFQKGTGSRHYSSRQNTVECDSVEGHEGQHQQHQSVDHLLAQPSLSLDDMILPPRAGAASHSVARSDIDNRLSLHPRQGKYSTTVSSNNLPDLIRPQGSSHSHSHSTSSNSGARKVAKAKTTARTSHSKDNRPDKDRSSRADSPSLTSVHISATTSSYAREQRSNSNNNSSSRSNSSSSSSSRSNTNKCTPMITRWSQSGGVLQPPPTSLVTSSARVTRSEPGAVAMLFRADNSNISKVDGVDTTLVEEAFAFAERVAREVTGEKERKIAPRRSLINRERPPRWLLPVARNGGTVMPTKSSVSPAVTKGNEIENVEEDWVRGLPISFPRASSLSSNKPRQREQHNRRRLQRAAANCVTSSTNQTPSPPSLGSSTNPCPFTRSTSGEKQTRMDNGITPGKPKWETWTDIDCLQRLVDGQHGQGGGGEEKKAFTTAEMAKRFETGAGVEELRTELEASQASMRRSRHAIEEATGQWRLDRQRALAMVAV